MIGQRSSTTLIQLFHILGYAVKGNVMLNNLIQVNTVQYKSRQLRTTQQLNTTRSSPTIIITYHQLSSSTIIMLHHAHHPHQMLPNRHLHVSAFLKYSRASRSHAKQVPPKAYANQGFRGLKKRCFLGRKHQ